MFVDAASMLLFMMSFDIVAMVKQFPIESVICCSLAFHGDVVYIGSDECIIQWNVVTDAVVRLKGHPGLILLHMSSFCSSNIFS